MKHLLPVALLALATTGCPRKVQDPAEPGTPTAAAQTEAAAQSPLAATAPPTPASAPGAETADKTPAHYEVRDKGLRCITFPCPTFEVTVAGKDPFTISDVDFSGLKLSDKELRTHRNAMRTGTLKVAGVLRDGPKGPAGMGKTLVVSQIH